MREHKKSHLGIMGWAMFLAGAMSLGSCSSDETLESMEPKAITFGSISMENHSRAAYDPSYGQTTNPLDQFKVWGTVTGNAGTANIFNGAIVTNDYVNDDTKNYGYGQVWSCNQTQYWIPSATYNFMAIANANSVTPTSGIPTAINYTADGETDLLLGELATNGIKTVTTNASGNPLENPVAFTMTHLLSKVHFTFQDGSGKPVANTTITDIQVTGHNASGTYTIGATNPWGTLTPAAEGESLNFGAATAYVDANTPVTSADARLIIPGTQTWSISFKLNGSTQTLELKNQAFAPNQAYNLIVTVGSNITFTINSLEAWDNGEEEQNIPLNP